MYKPKNYTIQELVHPRIIKAIGEYNSWRRLQADALKDLQSIRDQWFEKTGSGVYCNRIKIGIDSRGLRPPNDEDGSFYSTHKQGGTFDLQPVNREHKAFWEFVYDLIAEGNIKYFNTMEDRSFTPTWTHVGYMNTNEKPLVIKP
jgi:hypothetical protein